MATIAPTALALIVSITHTAAAVERLNAARNSVAAGRDALTRARLDWRAACVADLNHCIANLNGFRAEAVTNLTTLAVTKSACVIGAPVQAPQLESIYVTTFNGLTAAVNSIPVQTDPVV